MGALGNLVASDHAFLVQRNDLEAYVLKLAGAGLRSRGGSESEALTGESCRHMAWQESRAHGMLLYVRGAMSVTRAPFLGKEVGKPFLPHHDVEEPFGLIDHSADSRAG